MSASPKRSTWVWSKVIYNFPKTDPSLRFLLFEIDTKDFSIVKRVLRIYEKYNLSVYYHETANGFHFISLSAMTKEEHSKAIREIKYLNPLCPLIALRIKPNKWENEKLYWKNGAIVNNECMETLERLSKFRFWLEHGMIGLIGKHYRIGTYPLEECPKCKKSDKIIYSYEDKKFKCMRCNVFSIPRGNTRKRRLANGQN